MMSHYVPPVSVISGAQVQRNGESLGTDPSVLRPPTLASIHFHIASAGVSVVGAASRSTSAGKGMVDGGGAAAGGSHNRHRIWVGGAVRLRVLTRGSRLLLGIGGAVWAESAGRCRVHAWCRSHCGQSGVALGHYLCVWLARSSLRAFVFVGLNGTHPSACAGKAAGPLRLRAVVAPAHRVANRKMDSGHQRSVQGSAL